jgi:glycosyltransferase involved in cell wall biosynthesis
MRICVVTSVGASVEPRGPRHALAAKLAFPEAEVSFVDTLPLGFEQTDPAILSRAPIERETIRFPTRATAPLRLAVRRARTQAARALFRGTGRIDPALFGAVAQGTAAALRARRADVYVAHNIETLLPAWRAAHLTGARLAFDCMEYYADMGDAQSSVEAEASRRLQQALLPRCALVIASSDTLAETLVREHGVVEPLAAYNTPALSAQAPRAPGRSAQDPLRLYWRNGVVGFGQRGLEDILDALTLLPERVTLAVQGRLPLDGGAGLRAAVDKRGLGARVLVLPPYAPDRAVAEASAYDVGLCLERRGPRNHDLTVSNKMFDYHMAGLAVIATDLPALRRVIERSGGGVVAEPGSPQALAAAVRRLLEEPELLMRLRRAARRFAEAEANLDVELSRIVAAMRVAFAPPKSR